MSEKPIRIQLRRTKGWRMPPNTIKVDRSTSLGNPYKVGDYIAKGPWSGATLKTTEQVVTFFRLWVEEAIAGRALPQDNGDPAPTAEEVRRTFERIRGKNLACWCRAGEPCHADVLLEIANRVPALEEVPETINQRLLDALHHVALQFGGQRPGDGCDCPDCTLLRPVLAAIAEAEGGRE